MINEDYKAMLGGKSVIRELSEYATARGAEIGYENVFDYSLGNPSVPCPQSFTDVMADMYATAEPVALHGYSPSLGIPSVRTAIAESLNRRFGMDYTADHIFPTTGAAGALAHALRVVTKPGDEVITFAPYFPEYQPYVDGTGARLTVVPADTQNFQSRHLPDLRRAVSRNRIRRRHPAVPEHVLRQYALVLLVLQVAEPAGRAHRLCGGESTCHRCRADRADVRPDQPRNRA